MDKKSRDLENQDNYRIMNKYILLVLLICFITWVETQAQYQKGSRPNIILVMTDDQGWFDAGFNGNENIITPNLDNLAKAGITLNRFYSASAVCSPTRASLISGRNPNRIGVHTANAGHMKKEEITIAELLKNEGYATGHFGKWHLGVLTKKQLDSNRGGKEENFKHFSVPSEHGYDVFFCTEAKVPTFDPMIYPAEFMDFESKKYGWMAVEEDEEFLKYGTAYFFGEEEVETENLDGDDSRVIMDRVIPFIENAVDKKKPFFSTVWFHTPHLPVVSGEQHRLLYKDLPENEQVYYGAISAMDEQMGILWEYLEEKGIDNNTMLWFCSDNGPENRTPGSAGEFRARKRSLYEGGVRVPAFVIWKDVLKGGSKSDFPMVTSDYLPTIIDFLDIEYPDSRPLDGISLKNVILGKAARRDKAIGFKFAKQVSWVSHDYKLISQDQGVSFELYNLLEDRSEQENIIDENPELAARMKEQLKAWLKSVDKSSKGRDY